jgi:hypothetical protein
LITPDIAILPVLKRRIAADKTYPARLGKETAEEILAWFRYAEGPHPSYLPQPEFLMEFQKIRRDVKPRRQK